MANSIYKIVVQHRVDSHTNWANNNITLKLGELGFINSPDNVPETAAKALVVGDNVSTFNDLYGYDDTHSNVFYSGIGAGYKLPKAQYEIVEGEEGKIGGVLVNSKYFTLNAASGLFTPLHFSASNEAYTYQGVTYGGGKLTFNTPDNKEVFLDIPGAHIRDLIVETETKTTSELLSIHADVEGSTTVLLENDKLEGIALYNYIQVNERRPYAVLGINNLGELLYITDYQGDISSSIAERVVKVGYKNPSKGLIQSQEDGSFTTVNHTLTLTPGNTANETKAFDYTSDEEIYIPNAFCETISNGDTTASVTADNHTIDISGMACRAINLQTEGVTTDTFNVEDGAITMNLSIYTTDDKLELHGIRETLEYNLETQESGRLNTIDEKLSYFMDNQITNINLDGKDYSYADHTFTITSNPAIVTDTAEALEISKDENFTTTITHKDVEKIQWDAEYPIAQKLEKTDGILNFTKLVGATDQGHMNKLQLGAIDLSSYILPSSAEDGTYVLKAVKVGTSITYSWVKQ